MDTVVELKDVSKKYGELAVLEHVDLSVRQDDFMIIYGLPSSGKTVLSRLLMGLEKPDAGDLFLPEAGVGAHGRQLLAAAVSGLGRRGLGNRKRRRCWRFAHWGHPSCVDGSSSFLR